MCLCLGMVIEVLDDVIWDGMRVLYIRICVADCQ
jgi:hypothetical protein